MDPKDTKIEDRPSSKKHSYYRHHRTGEDIDMLREREEGYSRRNRSSSDAYKDHIDGA